MNVLLTGANGQLGQAVKHALEVNAQIVKNDWFITTKEELDITDAAEVEKYVLEKHINIIVNCAAYTNVNKAEKDIETCRKVNVDGVANLAAAASKNRAILIHFSTDYVYNGMTFMPYDEERQTMPRNVYGCSKLDGEKVIIDSGCSYLIFRLQGLYSQYKPNFFSAIIKQTENVTEIPVVCDQVTGIVHASYVAKVLMEIIEAGPYGDFRLANRGIYNLSDEGCGSWYDYAVYALSVLGIDTSFVKPVTTAEYKDIMKKAGVDVADRPFYSVLSKKKFYKDFSLYPQHWSEGLNNYLNSERISKEWAD